MTAGTGILVLGYGNPGRRDDGLGPAVAARVEAAGLEGVETMWDYQPNIEHAADIAECSMVIFVDASMVEDAGGEGGAAYSFRRLEARHSDSFSSHVASPETVLSLAEESLGWEGEAYLMGVRGEEFESFEEALTAGAAENLGEAAGRLIEGLRCGDVSGLVTDSATDHSHIGGEPCKTESI